MKPDEVNAALAPSPAGAASQLLRAASRNPVRQAAADRPKQAPACWGASPQLFHCQTDTLSSHHSGQITSEWLFSEYPSM